MDDIRRKLVHTNPKPKTQKPKPRVNPKGIECSCTTEILVTKDEFQKFKKVIIDELADIFNRHLHGLNSHTICLSEVDRYKNNLKTRITTGDCKYE